MRSGARCVGGWFGLACWAGIILVAGTARGDDSLAPGTLSGRVVGPDEKPVVGALVTSRFGSQGPNGRRNETILRTDAEGRFRSGPLEPVAVVPELTIDANGLAPGMIGEQSVAIYPGQDHDLGTIRLAWGRVVTGRVIDVDGRPRADQALELRVYRYGRGHSVGQIGTQPRIETDADGRFRSPPLPVGRLLLTVRAPERQVATVSRGLAPAGEEDVGSIRLEADVPFTATVVDEAGSPVAGASISGTVGMSAITDAAGKFTIRGLGPNPTFQLRVRKRGLIEVNGMITVTAAGIRYQVAGADPVPEPVRDLVIVLRRAGIIEGLAIDAATGKLVQLDRVTASTFDRLGDGSPANLKFAPGINHEQPAPGRFRVAYATAADYHLRFQAEGYRDAEMIVPRPVDGKPVGGIVVRLEAQADLALSAPSPVAGQVLTGTVTRSGTPVRSGWVVLWTPGVPVNAPNAAVLRGRTTVEPLRMEATAAVQEGTYTLTAPNSGANFVLTLDEPGQPLTRVGPVKIAPHEVKTLDIAATAGGQIRGRIPNVPAGWEGNGWVVAFNKAGLRFETMVEPNGEFSFPPLPPGEYGLKVGHDAYQDAEVDPGLLARQHPESSQATVDPWQRAVVVPVESGHGASEVEVKWPD